MNIVHFWIVFSLILVLPVAREYKLLLRGERVEGEVTGMQEITSGEGALMRLTEFRAVIEYRYDNRNHRIFGPENVKYAPGKKLPLIIDPDHPGKYIIATVPGFYFRERSVILIIVLIIWLAIYTTIVQIQKGTVYRKRK